VALGSSREHFQPPLDLREHAVPSIIDAYCQITDLLVYTPFLISPANYFRYCFKFHFYGAPTIYPTSGEHHAGLLQVVHLKSYVSLIEIP